MRKIAILLVMGMLFLVSPIHAEEKPTAAPEAIREEQAIDRLTSMGKHLNTWYQPQYSGSSVQCIVVNPSY
jgi:hypothetical protein